MRPTLLIGAMFVALASPSFAEGANIYRADPMRYGPSPSMSKNDLARYYQAISAQPEATGSTVMVAPQPPRRKNYRR